MIATADIAWLAGLLEGEGSFVSRKENGDPRIMLDMTDRDVIDRAAALLGVNHIGVRNPGLRHHKHVYIIRLSGDKAAAWMMTLYSYMGQRRRHDMKAVLKRWEQRVFQRTPRKKVA